MLTAYEVAIAFIVASIVGLCAGYALWRYPLLGRAYDELLGALFASPLILLYPILLVIFGRGINTIIAMGTLLSMLFVTLLGKVDARLLSRE